MKSRNTNLYTCTFFSSDTNLFSTSLSIKISVSSLHLPCIIGFIIEDVSTLYLILYSNSAIHIYMCVSQVAHCLFTLQIITFYLFCF